MTGILQLLLGQSSAAPAYQIQRSLRFNSADTAYLSRAITSTGNQQKFTLSCWTKIGYIGSDQKVLLASTDNSTNTSWIWFNTVSGKGTASCLSFETQSPTATVTTAAVFRDPSAWYHIVVAVDTTQATNTNRVKIYVNGVQQTLSGTYSAQNTNTVFNTNGYTHGVGAYWTGTLGLYDGYMAEMYWVDGQQLTPSSFGQTNAATGVWEPIAYTGTYGTNGFYVNFSDNSGTTSTTLGKDYSGNSNNYTPNNFSVTAGAGNDSLVDTPTSYGTDTGAGGEVRGNYATLNPLQTGIDLSNGNLDFTNGAANESSYSTIAMTSGKWYCEAIFTVQASTSILGISAIGSINTGSFIGSNSGSYGWDANGQKYNNGSGVLYGSARSANDVIGCALDLDAGTITYYLNGVSQGTAFSSIPAGTYFFGVSSYNSTGNINFGQRPFAYTAPSGFKALCTQNLPTPTIGATSATQAGKYFNTVLWTGNGASPRSITGIGFQPDFVWIKNRTDAYYHTLYDAVRGVGSRAVYSSSTDEENGGSSNYSSLYGYLSSFDLDGFGLTSGSDDIWTNDNTKNYVAWNWKANGAGSTNTAGTITATVSANTTSGISVVTYSISSASSTISTFGHGLGVAPSMVLLKVRNAVDGWTVYHSSISNPNSNWLVLNTDAAAGGNTSTFSQSSTTFGVRETRLVGSGGSGNVIAYCFAPIAGYSAFGLYTGNGSTDGPFIYTGFRPKWILIKPSDSVDAWQIEDVARSPYNVVNDQLFPNLSSAEQVDSATRQTDFLSNGFKLRGANSGVNGNAVKYIYAAFAEFPFKYTLAR